MNKFVSHKTYPVQETDWGFYIDIEKCNSYNNSNDEIMRAKYKVIADRYYHKYELNKNKIELLNDNVKKIEINDAVKKLEINDETYSIKPDKSHCLLFQVTSLTITILSCYYIFCIL